MQVYLRSEKTTLPISSGGGFAPAQLATTKFPDHPLESSIQEKKKCVYLLHDSVLYLKLLQVKVGVCMYCTTGWWYMLQYFSHPQSLATDSLLSPLSRPIVVCRRLGPVPKGGSTVATFVSLLRFM